MKIGSAVQIFIGKSGMESSKICNAVDVFLEKSATQTKENLGLRQHDLRLDAGAGVNQVVAEEDLWRGSAGSAVLGHVVSTDVDCGGAALFHMVVTLGFTVYMT